MNAGFSRRAIDSATIAGITALLVFCPLAFGAVHAWPTALMEALTFFLVILWMGKLLIAGWWPRIGSTDALFWLPLALFVIWILFELVPLPPSIVRVISPATFELYAKSLRPWPDHAPYGWITDASRGGNEPSQITLLPTPDEVRGGAKVPFAGVHSARAAAEGGVPQSQTNISPAEFRPLSIETALTQAWTLKILAYLCLFLVVAKYPFGESRYDPQAKVHFYRFILKAMLIVGLATAVLGIMSVATWNGRMLWFYVPNDWGAPQLFRGDRARGPFINADHFANFVSLFFPLSLACSIFPTFIETRHPAVSWRILSGCTGFLIFCAVILSLSRGGWINVTAGTAVLVWLCSSAAGKEKPALIRSRTVSLMISGALLVSLLAVCLMFVGGGSRRVVGERVGETVAGVRFDERLMLWKSSFGIVKDFPVFGTGLGTWPEIFPRYRSAPWSDGYFREAHNDYAQIAAETGLVGLGLLCWMLFNLISRLRRAVGRLRSDIAPIYYALIAGMVGMMLHEAFDFSLHIPANAVFVTVIAAIALRMATHSRPRSTSAPAGRARPALALVTAAAAALLMVAALGQRKFIYPYDMSRIRTAREAADLILNHPASAFAHVMLVNTAGRQLSTDKRLSELEAASWLDPGNPYIRDSYAGSLFENGQSDDGLKQIGYSVYNSPDPGRHYYLNQRLVPWLSTPQRGAVEGGFRQAIEARYQGAVDGLAWFYGSTGRNRDAANLYLDAARRAADKLERRQYLLSAGLEFSRIAQYDRAAKTFRAAAQLEPSDPQAYAYLATAAYAPVKDVKAAEQAIAQGIAAGADPFPLYEALAQGARTAGDDKTTELAQAKAVELRPDDADAVWTMGWILMEHHKFEQASAQFQRLTQMQPGSAMAFFELAVAEEGSFQYYTADADYIRAVKLAPDNNEFRQRHAEFQKKLTAANPPTGQP